MKISPKKLVILACFLLIIAGIPIAYFLSMKRETMIGIVDGHKIYEKDLSNQEQQSLFDARNQLYLSAENILAKRYFQDIIADYKKKNYITDELAAQQAYIEENIKIPENQISDFIKENSDNPQLKGKSFEEQKLLVEPYLMQQAIQSFFDNLVQQAVNESKLKVFLLKKPTIVRTEIQIRPNDPSIGPAAAPITMVEFADFQCPYCKAALSTVTTLLQKYEGQIRFVFKNFPLAQLHPHAINAAIAAKCAQEQGKFWEMHDKLFANYMNLSDELYITLAKQMALDMEKFKACEQNADVYAQVKADIQYGQTLGISATPAFYINGKLIMGAQSITVFEQIINAELKQ